MVKGYEFAKDQYVLFSPEEIKALEEVGNACSGDLRVSCRCESIDPVYFDKTYYLAPDKGAAKPYALLTEALKQAGRCGVGRWARAARAISDPAPDRRRARHAAAALCGRTCGARAKSTSRSRR